MLRHSAYPALTLLLVLLSGPVSGGVKGICSNCHSMHNSQDTRPMRFNSSATPLPMLLRGGCVECHTGLNSADNFDPSISTSRRNGAYAPRVMSDLPPVYDWNTLQYTTLAGGNFFWVATKDDSYGHNVAGITTDDTRLLQPPGYDKTAIWNGQVNCSGTQGCHGNTNEPDSLLALESAHHADTGAMPDGLTIGSSYRYLDGALGVEDDDWEFTVSTTDHNQYSGTIRQSSTDIENIATISGQCARCHGMFHNTNKVLSGSGISLDAAFQSPWLRHPTDYAMADAGEYSGYGGENKLYDPRVPLGRVSTELGNGDSMTNINQRVILCLSCHRAHGSPYAAMLRWDFKAWPVGGATSDDGCQRCHTSKS